MNALKRIVMIVLALALSMPVLPVSAARSASITITPPLPNPAPVGGEVSFAIVINVTDVNPGVAGVDVYLAYDDTLVSPAASPNSVVEPLPDFFGSSNITWYELLPKDKCPGGIYACIHLVAAGPAQVTHSGAVARFHFQVKAGGETCPWFWALSSKLVDKDGYPVDHTVDPKSCPPTVTVIGTVLRQGTPANPSGGGTRACSVVEIIPPIVPPVFTNQSDKDNFKFELTNPPSGTYTIRAFYSGYLTSETTVTIPGSSTTINVGTTTLCGGDVDVNDRNKINILDIGTIISKFGRCNFKVGSSNPAACSSASDADEPTDINDDGCVNISDLAIAAHNWQPKNNTGPTAWQEKGICDP